MTYFADSLYVLDLLGFWDELEHRIETLSKIRAAKGRGDHNLTALCSILSKIDDLKGIRSG